ncbi:hypothetical protein RZS08_42310, partial [Arthrospira platensis SPKY1]|nr:hypothetical protein [Arthrospira platensis SPKY1]
RDRRGAKREGASGLRVGGDGGRSQLEGDHAVGAGDGPDGEATLDPDRVHPRGGPVRRAIDAHVHHLVGGRGRRVDARAEVGHEQELRDALGEVVQRHDVAGHADKSPV